MSKIIYFKESLFNSKMLSLQQAAESFQGLLNEVTVLNETCQMEISVKSIDDIVRVAEGGEEALKQFIAESLPVQKIGPFKFKKRITVDILELPDLSHFNGLSHQIIHGSLTRQPDGMSLPTPPVDINLAKRYLIIRKQKVEINQAQIESLKESCSLITRTPDEQLLFESHQKLADAMHTFNAAFVKVHGYCINKDAPLWKLFEIKEGEVKIHHSVKPAVTKVLNGKEVVTYPSETVVTDTEKISEPSVTMYRLFYELFPFPWKE